MDLMDAIRGRRTVKRFENATVDSGRIATLLELAVLAPNHRLSEPWRFLVLGPGGRRAYGHALGVRKARKIEDPEMARALVEKIATEAEVIPATIGIVQHLDDNVEIREEDYAATWMAIQNILLGAVALGLGTHLRTGAVLGDAALREPLGVGEGERLVALVQLGVPAELAPPRPRTAATERTTEVP